jgi:ATP-dependent DNA helicase RecG
MDAKSFENIRKIGENIAVEFKRCKNPPGEDTFQTVCSFLNRFGGNIFMGVENDGKVSGIPHNSVQNYINNIISMVSNPDVFSPTVYLAPEYFVYNDMDIIRIHVPVSSEVHKYKGVIYDRAHDADVKVTSTNDITAMYIRKQNIFTERKVYPFVEDADIRFDMFSRIKKMAVSKDSEHPWKDMSDMDIIKSAGLYSKDAETGKFGYNLAAVMLLGTDEIIKNVCPTYRTDALLRKVNTDRYDDRLIVETNIIDSYPLLFNFAVKHLPDKFFLEDDGIRSSPRNIVAREMLVNTLMHREYKSSYRAKFIIEKDRMFTENANRASSADTITPDNLEPDSKNPIIASFFRNIGYADELGSGTRNLYRYTRAYSGKGPQMIEGDVFRTIVPLDDSYSFDAMARDKITEARRIVDLSSLTDIESKVYAVICEGAVTKRKEISDASGVPEISVRRAIAVLTRNGMIERIGNDKSGRWVKNEVARI